MDRAFDLRGKRVVVMGLGLHGGGADTVKFLLREGAQVLVTDLRTRAVLAPAIADIRHSLAQSQFRKLQFVLGRHRAADFTRADYILKNPGVPPRSPYLKIARRRGIPVISDMLIFFERVRTPAVIGVTGTRGKSTAVQLIAALLRPRFGRVWIGGNIRTSVLRLLPRIGPRDAVVLELSSFQLHDCAPAKRSPPVAVITNLMRDHADWHGSDAAYRAAKRVIFAFQRRHDLLFINARDPVVRKFVRRAPSRIRTATLPAKLAPLVDANLGEHYRGAAGLAVAVAQHFGVPARHVRRTLERFRGLEGREEELGMIRGRHSINDTTATIPDAAVAALRRFRVRAGKQKLILIAGGSDKKLRFSGLARAVKDLADILVLLPGTATEALARELKKVHSAVPVRRARSMAEAVRAAFRASDRGDWILLSPGAASFGLFKNEFDRGDQFAAAVRRYR